MTRRSSPRSAARSRLPLAALVAAGVAAGLLCSSPVEAGDVVPPAPSAQPGPLELGQAKGHYQLGATYYEQGDFAKAVPEFTRAYELSGKPDLLYNIAVCYDNLREDVKALAFYQAYLTAKPDAADRLTVQGKIDAIQRSLSSRGSPATPAPATITAPTPAAVPATPVAAGPTEGSPAPTTPETAGETTAVPSSPSPEPAERATPGRTPFWIASVAALTFGAGATTFYLLSSSANSALHDYPPSRQAADTDKNNANDDAYVADVALAGALVSAGVAAYLYVRENRDASSVTATAAPLPGGAALSIAGTF